MPRLVVCKLCRGKKIDPRRKGEKPCPKCKGANGESQGFVDLGPPENPAA